MKKRQKNKKNNVFVILLILLLIIIFLVSGCKIALYFISMDNTSRIVKTLDEYVTIDEDSIKVDFDKTNSYNSDTVAWLRVKNTNINYPVVKTNNNDYYLNHDYNKKYNVGGWIFADYRNKFDGNDKNIVIYGHAMKNKTMFGSLTNLTHSDWNKNESNRNIQLVINNKTYIYKVFSVYKIEAEDYYIKTQFSDKEYQEFLNTIKNRSTINYDSDLSNVNSILTLSTCYGNSDRLAVHAYLIDVK